MLAGGINHFVFLLSSTLVVVQETKAAQLAKANAELKAAQETLKAAAMNVKQVRLGSQLQQWLCKWLCWPRRLLRHLTLVDAFCSGSVQAEADIAEFKASKDKAARMKDPWTRVAAARGLVRTLVRPPLCAVPLLMQLSFIAQLPIWHHDGCRTSARRF